MSPINKANCSSAANKSQRAGLRSAVAFGVICHICGEQLGIKENQETLHRPHTPVPAAIALLNPTTRRPRLRDSNRVKERLKNDHKNQRMESGKWPHCFPLNDDDGGSAAAFALVHRRLTSTSVLSADCVNCPWLPSSGEVHLQSALQAG